MHPIRSEVDDARIDAGADAKTTAPSAAAITRRGAEQERMG